MGDSDAARRLRGGVSAGAAMFSTIPPLQMQAPDSSESGKSMVSSCNIAAFNLGNAGGARFGGLLLASGVSLSHSLGRRLPDRQRMGYR